MLLRRCLAKDAERRYHDIADVRVELDEALDPDGSIAAFNSASPATASIGHATSVDRGSSHVVCSHRRDLAASCRRTPRERRGPARVSIELPPEVAVYAIGRGSSVAISPDAQRIVYVAVAGNSTRLLTRPLDGLESTPVRRYRRRDESDSFLQTGDGSHSGPIDR